MRSLFTRSRMTVWMLAILLLPASLAWSQEEAAKLPSPLTPEAVDALVSRLSDREVRDLLLQELGARAEAVSAAPAAPKLSLTESLTRSLGLAARQIVQAVNSVPDNAAAMGAALSGYFGGLGTGGTIRLLVAVLAAFGVGVGVDRAYARWRARKSASGGETPAELPPFPASIPVLGRRLLRDAGGAILALVAGIVVLALSLPESEEGVGTTVLVWVVFVPRIAWIVLRFLLAPGKPEQRIVVTDDWSARVLCANLVGLAIAVGIFESIVHVAREIDAGLAAQRVGFWANVLIFVWLAAIFVICRDGLRSIVRGRNENLTRGEEWVVFAYPAFAVIAIAVTWLLGAIAPVLGKEEVVRQGGHIVGLVLILVAPMCDTIIRASVRLLVPPMRGSGKVAAEAYHSVWRSYIRITRVVVFGVMVVVLAGLWDVSLFGSGNPNARLSGEFVEALLIVVVGYVALEITSLLINRKLAEEQAAVSFGEELETDEGPAGGAASRMGTVLPPLSWALQAAIIVVTALTALGHVGVNVTALLAGAGVIGLAIGFGAQKLVSDVVSGLFFLIDDAFRINEYINVGGMEGTVERIALRSMLLRQSDGAINCIPYGNVSNVTNFGRDWGTMKQVFTVPFDTDIEKVRKIFKKIGQDLSDNPDFADAFIQPFKYKGVSQVNDVGIVVRGKFMFKPDMAKQFLIQREIYRRVQADFASAGIKFARREVRVSVDYPEDGAPEKSMDSIAQAVAASAAADDAAAAAKPKPGS